MRYLIREDFDGVLPHPPGCVLCGATVAGGVLGPPKILQSPVTDRHVALEGSTQPLPGIDRGGEQQTYAHHDTSSRLLSEPGP